MTGYRVQYFDNITYLAKGTAMQKQAYVVLSKHAVFQCLNHYNPILAGTIPINIAIDDSDLDIICCFKIKDEFEISLKVNFSNCNNFKLTNAIINGKETVIANFNLDNWPIEVFGQAIPTKQQAAYRHMIVEHRLLQQHGESLRQQIIMLKQQGYKTEPAFAKILGLTGNPYEALLTL